MTKPIEDSTNAAAIRAALDVPTTAELTAVDDAAQAAASAAAEKYTKPVDGIPAADLTAATQARLAKADAALPGNADALADLLEAAPTTAPASLARIQSSVSGDGIVFSDPLVKDPAGPTITLTGATGPAGVSNYANTSTIFDYATVGPTAALAANAAFLRGAYTDRHFEVTFGTNSADFYITQIRTQTNANIWWRDLGARKWVYAGNISLDATGQLEFYRIQWPSAKSREYKVVGINLTWASIKTQTTDIVFRCTDYGEQFAHASCDSYGVGVGGLAGMSAAAPYQTLQYLGYRPFVDAVSGSGWLTSGTTSTLTRITRSISVAIRKNGAGAETPITFAKSFYFLGYNDKSGDQSLIASSIDAMYAAHPSPKPQFFGPWEPIGTRADLTTTAATISSRAAALGAVFVPAALICTEGNKAAVTAADNEHPRQEGHNFWAVNLAKRAFALGLKAS
jgi:hypothetical protein